MRDADRHTLLIRTLKLLRLIANSRFGVTVKEMQGEIGLGKRSINRYLVSLKRAGIRIHYSCGGNGIQKKWRLLGQREHLARIGII